MRSRPFVVLILLFLIALACGKSGAPAADVATPAPPPADTPLPPPPTDTPPAAPAYLEPVLLADLQGTGQAVTDTYPWPACQKAVFAWHVAANSAGAASLIAHLHKGDDQLTIINAFAMDVPGGLDGATLQPLAGGEYYLATENTDAAWSIRVECQDHTAPAGQDLDVAAARTGVTQNYQLPACQKSVFAWNVQPNATGAASLIVDLHQDGESGSVNLVNQFAMDQIGPLTGEAVQPLPGGLYYLSIKNHSGPWEIRWECRD